MDITPTPDEHLPQYPKKKPAHPCRTRKIRQEKALHLTKTDCRLARRILKNGMRSMAMQLLGGTPIDLNSAEAKAQECNARRHQQAYDKLLHLLDYLEHDNWRYTLVARFQEAGVIGPDVDL